MNIQFTLARRYLSGRKLRTALTTLAIVFGVVVVFGMNLMLPALVRAFQMNVQAAAGEIDATITLKTGDVFDAGVAGRVTEIEGVRTTAGILDRTLNLPADYFDANPARTDQVSALTLLGIDPEQARTLHIYPLEEGRFLEPGELGAAVISRSLAEEAGIGLGDELVVPAATGETALAVVGILPARALPGNEEVLVTLEQAQAMLDMPGKINTVEVNFEAVDEVGREAVQAAILSTLGESFHFGSLVTNSEILTNIYVAQMIFNVLGVLALLMGGFIIFNTFRTVIAERRRDIGMLRALGANRATILGLILTEGLIQGLAGSALGLLLGYLFALAMIRLISPILQQFMNLQIRLSAIPVGLTLASAGVGVGITLLAGLIPAIGATRITPLEALRPSVGKVSFKRLAGIGFWGGLAMIAAAIVALFTRNPGLIGLGGSMFVLGLILVAPALVNPIASLFGSLLALLYARSGTADLAQGNLARQPGRAAVTASTTLISMAILVMAVSMFTSAKLGFGQAIRKSLGGDLILVPPSLTAWSTNVGAGEKLVADLRAVDGVETISALRFAPSQVGDTSISILGIDPVTYPKVSGLIFSAGREAEAYPTLAAGRSAIINPVLATTSGVQVGDEIELLTPSGGQAYRVVAIAGDYLNAKIATAYISHTSLAADFGRNEDVLMQVKLAPQADIDRVEREFRRLLEPYPQFRLINGRQFIEENLMIFETAFYGIFGLVVFLAIPSLIAMVNTLAIGVLERTREIGMLRAVGATRKQVRAIVLVEALILSGIGSALGILAGLYLGYMTVEAIRAAGFPMLFAFPLAGVLLAVAAGILTGVLAAVIPARQAARLDIVTALHYE